MTENSEPIVDGVSRRSVLRKGAAASALVVAGTTASGSATALTPEAKDSCKDDPGWEVFGFRNQGQCIRYVETRKDSRPPLDD